MDSSLAPTPPRNYRKGVGSCEGGPFILNSCVANGVVEPDKQPVQRELRQNVLDQRRQIY